MLTVETMTQADIPFALRLIYIENWTYLPEDMARLIAFEPQGCFVAGLNNRRVGIISTTSFGSYGFVGTLIVRKSVRGRGIGRALMQAANTLLQAVIGKFAGAIVTVGVPEVNQDAVRLYLQRGFVYSVPCVRMYLGRKRACENGVYGIMAPEKG